jgi:integrase/recombinase XerD
MSKGSKRPKAPKGCFWRGDTLYGRVQIAGGDVKWSLRTGDPKIAATRRKAERERQVAIARYGDARRSFAEAMDAWAGFIVEQVSPKTVERYTSSLAVLRPSWTGFTWTRSPRIWLATS